MRTPRLFVDAALEPGAPLDLPPSQSHYVRNVLRARTGQPIVLFNGQGGEYDGFISGVGRSVVSVEVRTFSADNRASPLSIHLGLAVTKRDAMDTAIQKATELGVSAITPVLSEFNATTRKSLDKRFQHWIGIIRSAAEQCERNLLPELRPISDFGTFVAGAEADLKLLAHPGHSNPLEAAMPEPRSIVIAVGPEGGFSESEVSTAARAGFAPIGLGPRILRADTAPLVLVSLAQARWGDLLQETPSTVATDHSM